MRTAFSDALVAEAKKNPKILLLTGDHGYALFDAFRRECPGQYINCGIAEQNMVGVAAGLARAGFRPVVYGLAAFVPVRVLEQIKIDICYENLTVLLIGDGAGFVYSHLGSSHQSMEDIACTRAIPSLKVLSPADRFEMTAAMELAFDQQGPVYLRMGKSDRGDVHAGPVRIGNGELLPVRAGRGRCAIIATGAMLKTAVEIKGCGADLEIWSAPSIKPLDVLCLQKLCNRVDGLIVIEEHSMQGGLGGAIAELVTQFIRPIPVCRIGVEDVFSARCGSYEYLLTEHGLDLPAIQSRIESFLVFLQ